MYHNNVLYHFLSEFSVDIWFGFISMKYGLISLKDCLGADKKAEIDKQDQML